MELRISLDVPSYPQCRCGCEVNISRDLQVSGQARHCVGSNMRGLSGEGGGGGVASGPGSSRVLGGKLSLCRPGDGGVLHLFPLRQAQSARSHGTGAFESVAEVQTCSGCK